MRVLLIEMDYDTRIITAEIMRDMGCAVDTAGTAALAHKLLGIKYDIILVDHYTYKYFDLDESLFIGKNVLILSSLKNAEETFKFLPNCNVLNKPFGIKELEDKCKQH